MSSGKLIPRQVLGVSATYKNCLVFKDYYNLLYVSGNSVVVFNIENKEQHFIPGTTHPFQSLGITCISTSHHKKVIAVAEKTNEHGIVSFYDSGTLRKKKIINYPEIGSKEVTATAFSDDGKFFAMQGGAPGWKLCLWNVEKVPKLLFTLQTVINDTQRVTDLSFGLFDNTVLSIFGKGIGKLLKYQDGQIKPMSMTLRREHANFTAHAWLSDERCVVGTEGGEILLIENHEFRTVVYPCGNEGEDMVPILCLSPTGRGFVLGTALGEIRVFEKAEDNKEQYSLQNLYVLPNETSNIVSLAMGLDDTVICLTDSHQIFSCPLYASNLPAKSRTPTNFDYLMSPFHAKNHSNDSAIIGMDVAVWNLILVSVAKDCTVRVWNLHDRKMEAMQQFQEEPVGVAIHPSGLYIAIAFTDRLRIASIFQGQISQTSEVPIRQCSIIKMSNGGNYIAINSASTIMVYDLFTLDIVASLRGHSSKIRSISWMNLDSRICTVGSEGAVFYWDVFPSGSKRQEGILNKTISFTSGAGYQDRSKAFVSMPEKCIREYVIVPPLDTEIPEEPREVDVGVYISTMVVDDNKRILFAGSADDYSTNFIASFLTFPQLSSSFERATFHGGPITCMCLTHDGRYLFSGDADGVIVISEIEGSSAHAPTQKGTAASFEFADEIMLKKLEYESKKEEIVLLLNTIKELNINNEHALRLKEMEHKSKVTQLTTENTALLVNEKEKYSKLSENKSTVDEEFNEEMIENDSLHEQKLALLDAKYKAKLNHEAVRQRELRDEITILQDRWNSENETLVESHQDYVRELTEEYHEKLRLEHTIQERIRDERTISQHTIEAANVAIDKHADVEMDDMKVRFTNRLEAEEQTLMGLMSEHVLLKKSIQSLSKDAQKQKDENKKNVDKEAKLFDTLQSLEKDIVNHKKEIRERDDTITDKEKRIFDLKKKNQELEKFRFVLDYKIKELKMQIAPREEEIALMRKQIEDMSGELAQYHKSNGALNLMISELKLKADGMRREFALQEERYQMNSRVIEKYKKDLQEISTPVYRESFVKLKVGLTRLYREYLQDDVEVSMATPEKGRKMEDPQLLYNRDREQLERSLESLRRASMGDAKAHKRDMSKLSRENVVLTGQLNELRKDFNTFSLKKRAIEESKALSDGKSFDDIFEVLCVSDPRGKVMSPSQSPKRGSEIHSPNPHEAGGIFAAEGVEEMKNSSPMRSPIRSFDTSSPRTTALKVESGLRLFASPKDKNDISEAWREIQIQNDQMQQLENQLQGLCNLCRIDAQEIFQKLNEC